MATCVNTVSVFGFSAQAGNTRTTTANVLQVNSAGNTDTCAMLVLSGAEYAALKPLPRLTVAEVNQLAAAVLTVWAVAFGVRLCYRFFKH
jgi:hypothetical protein